MHPYTRKSLERAILHHNAIARYYADRVPEQTAEPAPEGEEGRSRARVRRGEQLHLDDKRPSEKRLADMHADVVAQLREVYDSVPAQHAIHVSKQDFPTRRPLRPDLQRGPVRMDTGQVRRFVQ